MSTTRTTRRKEQTRARLVSGALRVMAEKGVAGATIQEITEAADVGFGSFYNYFSSKEAIAEAAIDDIVDGFGSLLDRLATVLDDPAEVMAASVRYTLRRAREDRLWSRFLVLTGFLVAPRAGLVRRMARDVRLGIEARRFRANDVDGTVTAIAGTVLAFISADLNGDLRRAAPERAATIVLRLVGVSDPEARDIARRRLPRLPEPVPTA